ncbi:hypothetical protein FHT78_002089 [Rhizobium sp. BK196]|uniref:DUF2000 domain-containing protein n=1 Tax=unclassified Rhizobium TaxID=2613769 RepID=UPI001615C613|nr:MULTISPECIES: DUF2000 domain-containing protein [unclassified Rhizobium]MBB3310346.1 hypothetical protein [Rhizobium sp. BK196]MBB3464935.1 hypothetical protein [Rhizobium sp. BK377]
MLPDIRIAIVVDPKLPPAFVANTVSAIGIGMGAKMPLLGAERLSDRAGRTTDIVSNRPVLILQADGQTIRQIMLKALNQPEERAIVPFPGFARSLHDYADYQRSFPQRDLNEEVIDGLGLAGPAKWVRSLTGSLKLLR